jgi:hypothetical protein
VPFQNLCWQQSFSAVCEAPGYFYCFYGTLRLCSGQAIEVVP